MVDQNRFLDLFIALFALLRPLYAIPVFLGLTSDYTARQRQRTADVAALGMLKGQSEEDEDAKEVVKQKGAKRNAQSTGPSRAIELFHNRRGQLHASTSSGRTGLL